MTNYIELVIYVPFFDLLNINRKGKRKTKTNILVVKDSSSRFVASYLVKFKGRINFLRLMQNAYYFFLSNHNVQL